MHKQTVRELDSTLYMYGTTLKFLWIKYTIVVIFLSCYFNKIPELRQKNVRNSNAIISLDNVDNLEKTLICV